MAVGFLGYGTWWVLHRHSSPRFEDLAPIGIGLVVAIVAVGIYRAHRRALAELHVFLQRPAEEVVWIYLSIRRSTCTLVLCAMDGATTDIQLAGPFASIADADTDAILREAHARYPHATQGFHRGLAHQFAQNPRALLRA